MLDGRLTRRGVLASTAAGVALTAGCTGMIGSSENPLDPDRVDEGWPIEVGVLAPLTGPLERIGRQMLESVTVAEAQVMAADTDFWVDYQIKDTESDPDRTVEAAEEFLDDGIELFFGPARDESAAQLLDEVLIPQSAVAVTPTAVRGWTDANVQRSIYSFAPIMPTVAQALGRLPQLRRDTSLGIIYSDAEYGRSLQLRLEQDISARGIEITNTVTIDPDEAEDLHTEEILDEAVAGDPDSLIFAVDHGEGTQLLETYYNGDYDIKPNYLADRLRDPDIPTQIDTELTNSFVVGIQPVYTRGGFAGRVEDYEEGVIAELDVDLAAEILDRERDGVNLTLDTDTELEPEELLQPAHLVFDRLFDRFPTNQELQSYDALVVLVLAGFQVGQGNITGERVGEAVPRVSDFPGHARGVQSYGQRDWWEGLDAIGAGTVNAYQGATGEINWIGLTGLREEVVMDAVRFAPESETGFEIERPFGVM